MRTLRWNPEARDDLGRLDRKDLATVTALADVYLTANPQEGGVRMLQLPAPWGAVHQLRINQYRILFDIYDDEDIVDILSVFEKPNHLTTVDALTRWLGSYRTRRTTP